MSSLVVPARLSRELARQVDSLVESGQYVNRSQVMKEATKLLLSLQDVAGSGPQLATVPSVRLLISKLVSIMIREQFSDLDSITLYGSLARNESRPESDIDMLVITKNPHAWQTRSAIYDLVYPIMIEFAINFSFTVFSTTSWKQMIELKDPFAESIKDEGIPFWKRNQEPSRPMRNMVS